MIPHFQRARAARKQRLQADPAAGTTILSNLHAVTRRILGAAKFARAEHA
jgi:hypothetical protein